MVNLSIFTTVTNPKERGDNWEDAILCYLDLANELVVVDGNFTSKHQHEHGSLKIIDYKWPKEFSWEFIGQQFQRGYEACTGDIVLHMDLDFIVHEKDFDNLKRAAQNMLDNKLPAMTLWKYQFVLPDRYNLKSRLVVMVNKRDYGDRIKFDSSGDLCQPSLDGKYLNPNEVPEARVPFYNYEKLLKTKEQIAEDQGRMERAWFKHFGVYQMGSNGTNEVALDKWIEAQKGKFSKPQKLIALQDHPKYVQESIKNLKPENWGYNGFGSLETNSYV